MLLPVARRAAAGLAAAIASVGLLAPPASAQYTLYYGNLHAHCNLSDDATSAASGPPDEAFDYARNTAGLDFMSLTDHSHYLSTSEYNTLKSEADAATVNGQFVGLAGQEHGNLSTSTTGAFGHLNVYEYVSVLNQGLYRQDLTGTYNFLATNVDRITGAPLVGSFNHPTSSGGQGPNAQFADFAYDATGAQAMKLLEVINGKRSSDYETEWFEALAKGWRVGAIGNQDNHNGEWGDQVNNAGNIPLTGLWALGLTKADVLEAIGARRTFAMEVQPVTDRFSLEFTADGNWMGSEYTTSADSVAFNVDVSASTNISSIALFRNGTLIQQTGAGATSVQWSAFDTPGPGDFYYLVRVTQADGDRAWSSPIWVTSTSTFSLPIATVNMDDASGLPTMWFQTATVQGLVTVPTDTLNTVDNEIFIQDPTGGVMVLEFGAQSVPVQLGDNLLVTGTIDTFQGQTIMSAPSIIIQGTGGGEPPTVLITTGDIATNGETYEGQLVEIRDVTLTGGTWPSANVDGSVTIDDGSGNATMLIDKDTLLGEQGAPTDSVFSVKGIVTQRDISPPFDCCYALLPRFTTDIFQIQGVSVAELPAQNQVGRTQLSTGSPNPFRSRTSIRFEIAGRETVPVQLAIYDLGGRLVRKLIDKPMRPGVFETEWNGMSDEDGPVAAGVYFIQLRTPDGGESQKVIRLN